MNESKHVELATLLLRVTLGVMYIAHSVVLKGFTYGLPGTAQFFESVGLPGPLAYAVFAAEAVGGALLIAGIWTRIVSLGLIPILLGAGWVHIGNGWVFSNAGGGWEYPLFLVAVSVVLALLPERARVAARAPEAASTRAAA